MPNWCQNEVTITGDEEKLNELKELVREPDPYHGRCTEAFKWVHNEETCKGEAIELPDHCKHDDPIYKDTCDKRYREFSFNNIIPMPEELRGTSSPTNVVDTQEEVDKWKEEHPKWDAMGMGRPITKKEHAKLLTKHKFDNWYDWANANWDTKWDASEVYFQDDGWMLRYEFDTAWNPPEAICHALRERFPDLNISWFFREDGMEMAGYL